MQKPALTFPADVIPFVEERYQNASIIFEYGSGGSTVLAAEQGNKTIISIESDRVWAANLNAYLNANATSSNSTVVYVDIGATKEWGYPADESRWKNYPDYAFALWKIADARKLKPDLVLIDGRFRVGCFLASMLSVKRKTTLLFDDYFDRPHYHYVEQFFKPVKQVGRMAQFEIEPRQLNAQEMHDALKFFYEVG